MPGNFSSNRGNGRKFNSPALGTRENPIFYNYCIKKIIELRKRLVFVLYNYLDKVIDQQVYNEINNAISGSLTYTRSSLIAHSLYDAIYQSLAHVHGKTLTKQLITYIAEYISGNLPVLNKGKKIIPWYISKHYEWLPMQIIDVSLGKNKDGVLGVFVKQKVLGGSACPNLITTWWSFQKCKTIANKFLGFSNKSSKPEYDYSYINPHQLVSMRFYGLLNPEKSEKRVFIEEIKSGRALLKWNRMVIEMRNRVKFKCPLKLTKEQLPCYKCHLGYAYENPSNERCPIACRRLTLKKQHCSSCNQLSYFEPATTNQQQQQQQQVCYNCKIKALTSSSSSEENDNQ